MKNILLLGAGRSSGALINYLLEKSSELDLVLTIGDKDKKSAEEKLKGHSRGKAVVLDIENEVERNAFVSEADLVISLLPPALHLAAAHSCIRYRKHLITASYVSEPLIALDAAAREAGILILNECGLDPGIDHMSAMEVIHRIKAQGGELRAFHSYTGGLIAPESIDNPWGYKFTWNPRNVILAGQGTARYIQDGKYHYIPYSRLFSDSVRINLEGYGRFDGYANRDSLAYRHHYGLADIPTMIRGTLRHEGFCSAWQVFVTLGLTDDSFTVENSDQMTYRELVESFVPPSTLGSDLEERIAHLCKVDPDGPAMDKIRSTGILQDRPIGLKSATPAQILQKLLESKWVLKQEDKDMIVMQHRLDYTIDGKLKRLTCDLVVKGDDTISTAMAKTVGWPLGIAAVNLLKGKIRMTGVQLPVHEEIYTPILKELHERGISFKEKEEEAG